MIGDLFRHAFLRSVVLFDDDDSITNMPMLAVCFCVVFDFLFAGVCSGHSAVVFYSLFVPGVGVVCEVAWAFLSACPPLLVGFVSRVSVRMARGRLVVFFFLVLLYSRWCVPCPSLVSVSVFLRRLGE